MARFGFCGPTYQSASRNVDCERCVNRYPEFAEAEGSKSRMWLAPSPGTALFANIGSTSVLGQFACQPAGSVTDRWFAIGQSGNNQVLSEISATGAILLTRQITAPTTSLVTMEHNGLQLLICTGGQLWCFTFATNVLSFVAAAPANVARIKYSDGFFIAQIKNSATFYLSALLDGTTWPGLSKGQVSEFPDNVVSIEVNQRNILFLGRKASTIYTNIGALNVPFVPIPGVFIENGCGAAAATTKFDNSIGWLDLDDRGGAIARILAGYTPQRISNHAVEAIWQSYPRVDDAVGYAFQDQGHTFWHIYFPSGTSVDDIPGAGASWRYDRATGMWHEVAYWNTHSGHYEAHHSQNHVFVFGQHFVGDWSSGNLYLMSSPRRAGQAWAYCTDAGNPIRRMRRAPVISTENQWLFVHQLELDMEVGLGPLPALAGVSPSPVSYIIPDNTKAPWLLSILDDGHFQVTALATGTPQVLILNDETQSAQSWQVVVDATQALKVVSVPFGAQYPTTIPMQTKQTGLQSGIGVIGGAPAVVVPVPSVRDPQVLVRWSKDHAHTFSDYFPLDCGAAGEYSQRVVKRRIGRARNWVFEVVDSDPVPSRFVEAYIKATNFTPTERLTKQIGKGA